VFIDILEGFAIVRRYRLIVAVLGVTMMINVFGFSYSSLLAPIGQGNYGVSPTLVGVLAAAEPAGALIGGLAMASGRLRIGGPALFFGGAILFLATLALGVMSPWYWGACVMLFLGGFGTAGFGNMQTTIIMTEAPRDARSRVLGIVTMCIGVGPLGTVVVGWLADRIGAPHAVLILALIGLAGVILVRARWRAG
jgi:predicted MFS family arabinose efflux permease